MNLRRIRTRGKSRVGSTWMGRRLRSVLWRLMRPYFEGIAAEIDRTLRDRDAEIDRRLAAISALIPAPLPLPAPADTTHPRVDAEIASIRAEAAALASQLAAARKDAMAMAHRLAGLEEELSRISP